MRWWVKESPPPPKPNTRRVVDRFAWLPVRCGSLWLWLEPFIEVQKYQRWMSEYEAGYAWAVEHRFIPEARSQVQTILDTPA